MGISGFGGIAASLQKPAVGYPVLGKYNIGKVSHLKGLYLKTSDLESMYLEGSSLKQYVLKLCT